MKTKEELNALKEEFETVSRKLSALTEEELATVSGGRQDLVSDENEVRCNYCGHTFSEYNIDRHKVICPMNPFNLEQFRGLPY